MAMDMRKLICAAVLGVACANVLAGTPAKAAKVTDAAKVAQAEDQARIPVIIDTDMAIDDWAAMLYLLHHRQTRVLGITVTGAGEAHCNPGAQHAVDLVDMSPQKGIPVACGDSEPMDGFAVFPAPWRKDADAFFDVPVPAASRGPERRHAAQLLIDLLMASNVKVKLVVIGNATNVAQALLKQPKIKQKIERIYMMGGAIWAKGNIIVPGFTDHYKNKTSEWNVLIDPVATRIVLQSKVPLTLVALDGTNDVKVTPDDAKAFKAAIKTPSGEFYSRVLDKNTGFIDSGEYYFWDALTATLVTHPEFCRYQNFNIDVVVGYAELTNGDPLPQFSAKRWDGQMRRNFDPYFTGQTIISDRGTEVQVCMRAKPEPFKNDLIQTLNQ